MSRPWKAGEQISSRKLNSHSAALSHNSYSGPPGETSTFGSSLLSSQHDLVNTGLWVIATDFTKDTNVTEGTRDVYRHSWVAVSFDPWTQNWKKDNSRFGNKESDPLYAKNFGQLVKTENSAFDASAVPRPTISPYFVTRDPVTRKVFEIGAGGSFDLTETFNDTVIMILGTYLDYHLCADLDPHGPTPIPPPNISSILDDCGTNEECPVNAYAWSEYVVCGYKLVKTGRWIKNYRYWAEELNGATAPALRRFYKPFFGQSEPPESGSNSTLSGITECDGLKFLGYCSQGTLDCSTMPSWISSTWCLKIKFKTPKRPDPYTLGSDCDSFKTLYDVNQFWDDIIEIPLCIKDNVISGTDFTGVFDIEINFVTQEGATTDYCNFGPDIFDPCEPCDGFSSWRGRIKIGSGVTGNCKNSGHVDFRLLRSAMRDLSAFCKECTTNNPSPVKPYTELFCDICEDSSGKPFHFILPGTIEMKCCSDEEYNSCNPDPGGG